MNKSLSFLACACLAISASNGTTAAADKSPGAVLPKTDTVVWAGLDYALVRMFGTQDFKNPEDIVANYPAAWNDLFLRERIKTITSTLKKNIDTDTGCMTERNKALKTDQVIRQDGHLVAETHITSKDIAEAVRSYKMTKQAGLGLVFIVDRFVKSEGKGAVYLVWFDLASREVLAHERVVAKAGGVGFRNYWFGVIKNAESELKKYR